MTDALGPHLRRRREELKKASREFSVRKVAFRIGVDPSYLSNVETEKCGPPSEATILKLAEVLGEDPDILLAMAGKVASDLQDAIRRRPKLLARLIRSLDDLPDDSVEKVTKVVRDGDW
ncbi:MAG: helix-turn-helix transcriptional regulator [Pseudomonadota bacterium]